MAYSVVPTINEPEPSALFSTASIEERLHNLVITGLNVATGFTSTTCNSKVSFCAMFFCKRIVRIPPITSFTTSNSLTIISLQAVGMFNCWTIRLSPSLRSYICCHNSSVMKGMNGCSNFSKLSKKPKVFS